ncbi:MAG: family 20 glycosylhydrolase, partial [Ginsengibacter sp.]
MKKIICENKTATNKSFVVYFFITFFSIMCLHVNAADSSAIIPKPLAMQLHDGHFVLNNSTTVSTTSSDDDVKQSIQWFINKIATSTGYNLSTKKLTANAINLLLNKKADTSLHDEGYTLNVTPSMVTITANKPAGLFYGLQTVLQLLPPSIESVTEIQNAKWTMPCVDIKDVPRFGWRGLMLDVSRHFFTKNEVEEYIDQMARYKYNTLHLHLADDQGWRIEIKSLPELTSVGAWRVKRTGRWGTFMPALAGEPTTDGGFYTQEDMKEIIKYAQDRFITILPEIDVPAHSLALIASYPNLSCTQLPYSVNAGGKGYERNDNVLCIGNDSTFTMLDKIFKEIAALFPNSYIHIGGDEAYKGFWDACPKCQKRMADEHLKNVDELQSYFVKRVEKIIESKNKKLIGWDEILEGGLAPNATVMSWRGMSGGVAAARMNHQVVMTPWDYCYLDLYQGEPTGEPPTYGLCRLSDSYNYEPVPDSIDEKYILGGQGNLWSESIPTFRHAEYMTWPRGIALAEVYWSSKANKNWTNFITRLEKQFPRLDAANVKYSTSMYNVVFQPARIKNSDFGVTLTTEVHGLDIYYTFDNTNPDQFSPKFDGKPIKFPVGSTYLNAITYRDGNPIGEQINIAKDILAQRLDEKHHVY